MLLTRPPLVSENGEDFLLLAAFAEQPHGFFIDVGAFDGLHLSNTWSLEQRGWSGYCLEPVPEVFARLAINRPRSICLPTAAGRDRGRATLVVDPTMLLSSISADRSTVREAFERMAADLDLGDEEIQVHTVDVLPLDDLLRKHAPPPRIDVVSIDVGGAEFQVLDGLDLEHHRPRVLVVAVHDEIGQAQLERRCAEAGYEAVRLLGNSMFFAFEDHLKQSLTTTWINCHLPANIHPLGPAYTLPDFRRDRVLLFGETHDFIELYFRNDQ